MESASVYVRWLALLGATLGLAACGGGGSGGNNPQPTTYTVGGSISGLTVDGLVLANSGATLTVNSGASTFSFATALASGAAYAVTVQTTPNGLTCSVANGTGTVGTANVSNIVVTCSDKAYALGGTISGLISSGLVLSNGTDQLSVSSGATSFTMPAPVAFSSSYDLKVATQPQGLTCSVQNGTATMGAAAVTNIAVTCTDQLFTVGGSVGGLTASGLVLANGNDTVTVPANATVFTFPTSVAYASKYAVTVSAQPAGLMCSITGGSGTMPPNNVSSVQVSCSPRQWTWEGGPKLETLVTGTPNTGTEIGVYGVQGQAATTNWPGARDNQMAWTDSSGHFWLFGGDAFDSAGNLGDMNDLWMYDPTSAKWTWMSGSSTNGSEGTYGALGATGVPAARHSGMTWVDTHGNLWLYGGSFTDPANAGQTVILDDLWSYNIASGLWTRVNGSSATTPTVAPNYAAQQGTPSASNTPGGRQAAATWIDSAGHLWLFGGFSADGTGNLEFFTDLWSFDSGSGQWTWASGSQSFNLQGTPATSSAPPSRAFAASWIDSHGALWLFGGGYSDAAGNNPHALNDLWVYTPSNGQWAYVAGGIDVSSTVGTTGIGSTSNIPGARGSSVVWTDNVGHIWVFGGKGYGTTSGSLSSLLNDLWTFDPTSKQWTYVSGPQNPNTNPGVYFLPGQGTSQPGARATSVGWVDSSGQLWMFGGNGFDSSNSALAVDLNDLWMF